MKFNRPKLTRDSSVKLRASKVGDDDDTSIGQLILSRKDRHLILEAQPPINLSLILKETCKPSIFLTRFDQPDLDVSFEEFAHSRMLEQTGLSLKHPPRNTDMNFYKFIRTLPDMANLLHFSEGSGSADTML
ncbi:hypothetical protein V2J09_016646 [Rumex salicifolius]